MEVGFKILSKQWKGQKIEENNEYKEKLLE